MYLPDIKAKLIDTQIKLSSFGYPHFDIDIAICKLPPGVAGCTFPQRNRIEISIDYLNEHKEEIISRTVPHEICHSYVSKYFPKAKQFHGTEFRNLMYKLGCDPTTRHNMRLTKDTVDLPSNKRKVKRFVYHTIRSNIQVNLTSGQHEKMEKKFNTFTYHDEYIKYSNKIIMI